MKELILLVLFLALNLFSGFASEGALTSKETTNKQGQKLVTIANDYYKLTFNPSKGGRCESFLFKKSGRELVYDGKTAGLFQDHFAHQGYPGELLDSAYKYKIEKDGDKSISICLWIVAKGGKRKADPLTKGLKVQKVITLFANRRDVEIVNTFTNPTTDGKNVGLWVQQCFCYSGDRLFDLYYRPSTHGIHLAGRDDTGQGPYIPTRDVYSADWVGKSHYTDAGGREPVAGWTAGRDRRSDEGIVFLLDYNYLDILYNCSNSYTTEWFMDKVPLPPGKSWSTKYNLIPVNGFKGFSHASDRLIANTHVIPGKSKVTISHQFAGTTEPAGDLTVKSKVYGVRSKKEVALPTLKVGNVGLAPKTVSQTWEHPQTEPLVIRMEVAGPDWEENYEYQFVGKFTGGGIEGAGEVAEYETPRPKKQKTFLKPDSWTRTKNKHLRVLVMYGLYSDHYGIEKAAKALDPDAEVKIFDGWHFFPPTYTDLLGYDVIVLSNMPIGPEYANVMIADVVRYGGLGLLAIGGIQTFGSGQWIDTALGNVLPAEIRSTFDMKWEKQGASAKISTAHPIVNGVNFPDNARFYWIHEMFPRKNSTVVMTAGNRQLVIVGQEEKGRVVTIAGTCHGEPKKDQIEAWRTPAWEKLLSQSMSWLRDGK